ncbi:metallopeptidase TldD-related protein [Caulobacter sp.]|uniref:TldD/PmbA family protein n=1 Tax=Caulobacter sp. TaxID=78 RepID=UPI0031E2E3B5
MVEIGSSGPGASPSVDVGDGYLLYSEAELADLARAGVARATALGCDQARVLVRETAGLSVRASQGEIATSIRDGAALLDVTVFKGGRTGRATTQALSPAAIERTVDHAVAIAAALEPDPLAGLADETQLAWTTPAVSLFAPSGLSPSALGQAALAIERGALAAAGGQELRISEAGAASHDSRWALATSQGFCRSGGGSAQRRWANAIAQRDNAMETASWSAADRRLGQLMASEAVGREAAERAIGKLGAQTLSSRRCPVLLDATIADSLVTEIFAALAGRAQVQGQTFIPGAVGQTILPAHVDLREDPFEPFGLASAVCDSEGVAGARRAVVDAGVVAGLFLSARSGRQLGRPSTGNADGFSNLALSSRSTAPGDDMAALWRRMGDGLWLTEFLGGGVNPVTGAYAKAAAGFWIQGGELAGPVQGFTVAGNLQEMLRDLVAIGSDVHRQGAIRTGSILLESLQIAGR